MIFIARFWIASICKEFVGNVVMPDTRAVLQDRLLCCLVHYSNMHIHGWPYHSCLFQVLSGAQLR